MTRRDGARGGWALDTGVDRDYPHIATEPIHLYAGENVEYPAGLTLAEAAELRDALDAAIAECATRDLNP